MHGRDPEYWRAQLTSEHLPVRLFALRMLRQLGSRGAKMLVETRIELPEWPLAWALQGCATPSLLRSAPPHSPHRLALTLQRRTPRPRGRLARHSLEACIQGLRQALNPHLRLSWMMVLLEQHGPAAAEPLVALVANPSAQRQQWDQMASLAAWAVAQLGRPLLFALLERFKEGQPIILNWLCQVIWYLGPQAQGSESFIASLPGLWASAALYSLESSGSLALIQRREAPLWMDKISLVKLAELVQSSQREERLYAARALPGWGPALPRVARLLEKICHDPEAGLRDLAWKGLEPLGGVTSPSALVSGLQSDQPEIRRAALQCFRDNYGPLPLELLRKHLHDPLLSQLAVLALQEGGLAPSDCGAALQLLKQLPSSQARILLSALVQQTPSELPEAAALVNLVEQAQEEIRLPLTQLFLAWRLLPQDLLPLAHDQDPTTRQRVSRYVWEQSGPSVALVLLADSHRAVDQLPILEQLGMLLTWQQDPQQQDSLALLLERLHQLSQQPEADGAPMAYNLLQSHLATASTWSDFHLLPVNLQKTLLGLLRHHLGQLPESLERQMLQGQAVTPWTLSLALDLLPKETRSTSLWTIFIHSPRPTRLQCFEAIQKLGTEAGWALLLELIAHPQAEVAEDAVALMLEWLAKVGSEGLVHESILRMPLAESTRRLLAIGIAELILQPQQSLLSRWFDWALALARQPGQRPASLAVQCLGRFFRNGQEEEPHRALRALLKACNHPQREVRLEAVTQLPRVHLHNGQRWLIATTLRSLGIDPEPLVQTRRLVWLQEADELTSYERHLAKELLDECEDAEVLQELNRLL